MNNQVTFAVQLENNLADFTAQPLLPNDVT